MQDEAACARPWFRVNLKNFMHRRSSLVFRLPRPLVAAIAVLTVGSFIATSKATPKARRKKTFRYFLRAEGSIRQFMRGDGLQGAAATIGINYRERAPLVRAAGPTTCATDSADPAGIPPAGRPGRQETLRGEPGRSSDAREASIRGWSQEMRPSARGGASDRCCRASPRAAAPRASTRRPGDGRLTQDRQPVPSSSYRWRPFDSLCSNLTSGEGGRDREIR